MRVAGSLRRRWPIAAAAMAALSLFGMARLTRSIGGERVASFEVRPGRFVREVEARGTLRAVRATPLLTPQKARRAQRVAFLAPDGARLKKGDLVVEFDPYEAEIEAADGRSDLAAARARIDKAEADGKRNERSIAVDREVATEDLSRAERYSLSDESLYSRHQIIESRLSRELATTQLEVAGQRQGVSSRLSAAERALGEIDARKAGLKLDLARQALESLRVLAPHDGLLVLERNWRGELPVVGDTLWPGQKLAELPDLDQLEAKVFVLEADGAGLQPGLQARLAIEGRPGEEFPATVARVEPLAKTTDWRSPVRFFEATLSIARTDPAVMKPGQRVRAMVRLEQADAVLVIPRGAVFERDGKRVVYRRQAGGFVPVAVRLGRQSVSRVVVDEGLASGDVVALRDPAARRPQPDPAAADAGPGR